MRWALYLISIIDNVRALLATGGALGLITALVIGIAIKMETTDEIPKQLLPCAYVALFCMFISTFIPSSKSIAMIYIVPKVIESEVVAEDLPELYTLAKEAMEEYIKNENNKHN